MPTDKGMYRPCWDLCLLLDRLNSEGGRLLEQAEAVLTAGAGIVVLREGRQPAARMLTAAEVLRPSCREHGALLLVEGRLDVALAAGADGALLGQDDLPVAVARRLLAGLLLGRWVASALELAAADVDGADFCLVPADTGSVPGTLRLPGAMRATSRLPLVVAGDFTAANVRDVVAAGADGVALRARWRTAEAAGARTAALLDAITAGRHQREQHAHP